MTNSIDKRRFEMTATPLADMTLHVVIGAPVRPPSRTSYNYARC
jgi:hypothetical protein